MKWSWVGRAAWTEVRGPSGRTDPSWSRHVLEATVPQRTSHGWWCQWLEQPRCDGRLGCESTVAPTRPHSPHSDCREILAPPDTTTTIILLLLLLLQLQQNTQRQQSYQYYCCCNSNETYDDDNHTTTTTTTSTTATTSTTTEYTTTTIILLLLLQQLLLHSYRHQSMSDNENEIHTQTQTHPHAHQHSTHIKMDHELGVSTHYSTDFSVNTWFDMQFRATDGGIWFHLVSQLLHVSALGQICLLYKC